MGTRFQHRISRLTVAIAYGVAATVFFQACLPQPKTSIILPTGFSIKNSALLTSTSEAFDTNPIWIRPLGVLIAGFDGGADTVSAWRYSNGPEYPGAVGSLVESYGVGGSRGARLNADLGCGAGVVSVRSGEKCGAYVAMTLNLSTPISPADTKNPALEFDLRVPDFNLNSGVRIVDSTGQTLQYDVPKGSLEAQDGSTWKHVHLSIASSATHFGGVNDGQLHLPVSGVQILANRTDQLQPPSYLLVDDVALVSSPNYVMELHPNATTAFGGVYDSYFSRFGVCSYTTNSVALDKAIAVGFSVVRREMRWSNVEKSGTFDFTSYDADAAYFAAKGLSVLWLLNSGHPDHGGTAPLSDADQAAFATYARAVAAHYKGKNIVGYEIWNEPDAASFWPSPDPFAYASLLNKAAAAIRGVDPLAKVVSGGTAGVDLNYSIKMASATNADLVDAVGVHPYAYPLGKAPETYSNGYTPLRNALSAYGLNKPLWTTEWGISSYGEFDAAAYGDGLAPAARNRQGILVLRMVLSQIALNSPLISVYSLTDMGVDPTDREYNFGLLTNTAEDKPAIVGLRSLYSTQKGRVYKGLILDVPPGVHMLRWDGSTDQVFVIWADNTSSSTVTVKLPSNTISVKGWDGIPAITSVVSGVAQVEISDSIGPIFVRVKR